MLENVKVDIPFYVGKESNYGTRVVRTALRNELEGNLESYQFVPGENGAVRLVGEGPYSKSRLFGIIKQAILERIQKRYSKYRFLVKDKLHIVTSD